MVFEKLLKHLSQQGFKFNGSIRPSVTVFHYHGGVKMDAGIFAGPLCDGTASCNHHGSGRNNCLSGLRLWKEFPLGGIVQ